MRKRIMMVDHNQLKREVMGQILEEEYEIVTAPTREEGLSRMKDFGADLILPDIMMPGIDGYGVSRQVKSAPYGALTLVALVSSRGSARERVRGCEAETDDYIVKPFGHDELAASASRTSLRSDSSVSSWKRI